MRHEPIQEDDIFYPLIQTPFGKVPLIGATMTDEREREITTRYGASFKVIQDRKKIAV